VALKACGLSYSGAAIPLILRNKLRFLATDREPPKKPRRSVTHGRSHSLVGAMGKVKAALQRKSAFACVNTGQPLLDERISLREQRQKRTAEADRQDPSHEPGGAVRRDIGLLRLMDRVTEISRNGPETIIQPTSCRGQTVG
jgi:hypothetical protein